ncbi:MAG: cation:proton antiporter [Clostridium sp.]|uniref:cation:proton antiporter n=1 Tax=Clostridium sp. TaxID=1506 RepID=UPI002FCB6996
MEEILNYDSLLILAVVAFFTPFLVAKLKKIKVPYQVGEIFIGIILGKSFFNVIKPDVWILFLSNLGLAYLMFLSGLEINFEDLKLTEGESFFNSKVFSSIKVFIFSLILSNVLAFTLLKMAGLDKGSLFFALLFTSAAPGLIVPMLKSKRILSSDFGQTLLIFSLIAEFVCLIGITFIASVSTYGLSLKSFTFLITFLAAIVIYLICKAVFKTKDLSMLAFKNLHISVRGAFVLVLVLVAIAQKTGSEIILGSFLAGIIFSLLVGKAKEEISHQLDVIGYGFLIPIFFIMVGVNIDLRSILENPSAILKIPLFLLVFFLVKFIPCLLFKNRYGVKNSIAASMILTAQLSLTIVGAQMAVNLGYITEADYSAFIVTTVISCIVFPILFEKFFVEDETTVETVKEEEKIIIREFVLSSEWYIGKSLKDWKLPNGCRVFSIVRDGTEIMPTADTLLKDGDLIIVAGVRHAVDDTLNMLTVCNLSLPK